jgi:hypothetical protein
MSIKASCHCGTMTLTLAEAPSEVTDCTCSICRRYGALWAYYSLSDVTIMGGTTDKYLWNDRSISFHRCRTCGCVTHWSPETRSEDRMGVNARLLDLAVLETVRVRHLDGAVSERYLD